jgi:N-acyl homoserine lactone hydrolase
MKFFVLPVGTIDTDKSRVFTPGKDEGVRLVVPSWVGLIQAHGLNILIDSGMHPVHIEKPLATFEHTFEEELIIPIMTKEDTLVHQINKIGLEPKDIDFVINTHLHFDHCGCNAFFPKATFIVQRDHYQHALASPESFPPQYYFLPGLNYHLIDGEMTLLPGIELLVCPGHVPAMMSVVLRLEKSGTIVVASDAISLKEHLDEDRWEGYSNPILASSSARRLAAIAQAESGSIFFGHDPEWWKTVKIAPDFYE